LFQSCDDPISTQSQGLKATPGLGFANTFGVVERRPLKPLCHSLNTSKCVARNQQLFISRNYISRQTTSIRTDSSFETSLSVSIFGSVKRWPHPLQPRTNSSPYFGRVLADSSGEDHCVGSPCGRQECADVFPDAITKHLDCQMRAAVIVLFFLVKKFTHVISQSRYSQ